MAGLASLAAGLSSYGQLNENRGFVQLTPLDDKGQPAGVTVAFQYFPETLTDSKAVNWQAKEIPGGSLPLYQWTSSGERTISFTAQFSTDIDATLYTENTVSGKDALESRLESNGVSLRNTDVRSAVAWLRQYMLPVYGNGPGSTKPPSKLMLYIKNSGIGIVGGDNGMTEVSDTVNCVMTQCEVSWEKFFPSGYPRLASVSLAFAQVPQSGAVVRFPQVTDNMTGAAGNTIKTKPQIGNIVYLGVGAMRKGTSLGLLDTASNIIGG